VLKGRAQLSRVDWGGSSILAPRPCTRASRTKKPKVQKLVIKPQQSLQAQSIGLALYQAAFVMAEVDKHTLSNYTEAEIKSAVFDWSIDFAASVLTGTVHYTFEVHSDTDKVVLDTSHLNVTAAREGGEDAAESGKRLAVVAR